MTLKEAIERYTSNAEYERIHGSLQGCLDFRQLAEWLKDYERLLDQKPKTGHWIKTPKAVMGEGYMWYCDKCEHQVYQDSSRPYPSERYCPNCGTKMVEPQEREVRDADRD